MDLRQAPGRRVHESPIYAAGPLFALLFSEITAVAVGTARGAVDVYEQAVLTRKTTGFPVVPMREHPDYHRFYGEAVQLVDVAEGALLSADRDYMEWSRRDSEGGIPFTRELELRLALKKQLCSKLASDAVDLVANRRLQRAQERGSPRALPARHVDAHHPQRRAAGAGCRHLRTPVLRGCRVHGGDGLDDRAHRHLTTGHGENR